MIPLRDVIPSRATPVVTLGLIALNAGIFLLTSFSPGSTRLETELTWGLIPAQFSWLTLLTSMFLHDGWVHVIANVWALWIFGDNVEDCFGRVRYLLLYLLSGVLAGLVQFSAASQSLTPLVGAGGAIAGVLGAYSLLYPRSRILVLIPMPFFFNIVETPAIAFMALWLAVQLLVSIGITITSGAGGVIFLGIGVGFIAGLGAAATLRGRPHWS